jgi:heme oxygenase
LDIQRLRDATAADHAAVEETVPLMSGTLTLDEYAACLQRLHGIVSAWEAHAAAVAPPALQPLLAARRRTPLLERDLVCLGVKIPSEEHPNFLEVADEASIMGAMYVMEGSTLGGQLIARHVEKVLSLSEGNTFFRGHGDRTGLLWREFCEILRTRVPENESDVVIRSAKMMFQTFGSWMQVGVAQR